MIIAITLHILAAVIWVGGMFFAYTALRPVATTQFEPPVRLTLWSAVFKRFFPWVIVSIIVLLGSGFWMIYLLGGMAAIGMHVHIMLLIGIVMTLIFFHVYFGPFKKLNNSVIIEDWPTGGAALNQIRKLILLNLALGLLVIIIASAGRYL
ncbi:MAG: CopD family protein [Methylophaga sp.]|nr:CopD family protein [Methylophaga sp.]